MVDRIAGLKVRSALRSAATVGFVCLFPLLQGCALSDAPVLFPKGPIALAERDLLFTAFGIMMIVAIPAIILTLLFAWRYRKRNGNTADYAPEWDGSWGIEAVVWLVPAAIVIVIGTIVWDATHRLDPYKALASDKPAFKVQAVALDWKWLFLYPELGTASVNELAFPADRPLTIEITSDTVMNSLMIPALGGQIYAMAGMRSELNLIADGPGTFNGRNTMYSGDGFSDQHFKAHAMNEADFAAWKEKVDVYGYVKYMHIASFQDFDNVFSDNLIHNRLNTLIATTRDDKFGKYKIDAFCTASPLFVDKLVSL